jgi:dTDP-4-amino-4,6-dideoxygalactose transaminase
VPVHRQAYILERGLYADLPVTDGAAAQTLALPMHPGLTEAEQGQVIEAVRTAVGRHLDGAAGRAAAGVVAPAGRAGA